MYPTTPLGLDTQGKTEEIIGSWIAKSGRRSDVVIATKIVGGGSSVVRERGGADISPTTIREAVETSLKRLQTDYIEDRKSTRLNSSHVVISYAVFCLKKKNKQQKVRKH